MADYIKRISDLYLLGTHTDGEAYLHTSINELEVIARTAINENYYDIQKLMDGTIPVGNASKLDEAELSRAIDEVLQADDNKIPSSKQVLDKITLLDNAVTEDLATKVDKVSGKGLSTNDYSEEDRERLANTSGTNTGDQDLSGKVDKIAGKGLSTNDYTTEDKNRLANTSGTNTGDQDLSGKVDKVTGKGLSTNDLTDILKTAYDDANTKKHVQNTDNKLLSPDKTKEVITTDNDGNVHVNGNIYQSGSSYETHAEEVFTKESYIILRDGATAGLGAGEFAGVKAKLYNGVDDGSLTFGADGVARVGDVGDEQPLATREETPIDGGFAKWDADLLKFVTFNPTADQIAETATREFVTSAQKSTWDGKADKMTGLSKVYVTDGTGAQSTLSYNAAAAVNNSIAQRTGGGQIYTATATVDGTAVNKGQMDTALGLKVDKVAGKALSTNDLTDLIKGMLYTSVVNELPATLVVGQLVELGILANNITHALPTGTAGQKCRVKFACGATPYTYTVTGTNFTSFSLTPVANTYYDIEFTYDGSAGVSKWVPSVFSGAL